MNNLKASLESLAPRINPVLAWITAGILISVLLVGCGPKPDPVPPPEPTPTPPPPVEPEPCANLSVSEFEKRAIEHLDRGKTKEARADLDCVLELRPNSWRARSLINQLEVDPVQKLGRTHFTYQVDSNETLSLIAERYLGSSLQFVILARYNNIAVPASLRAGQLLKIPGEKPSPDEDQPTPPDGEVITAESLRDQALSAESSGDLERAYELIEQARKLDPTLPGIDEQLRRITDGLIARLQDEAYELEVVGSIEEAVTLWRQILSIDPNNISAQLALKRLGAE